MATTATQFRDLVELIITNNPSELQKAVALLTQKTSVQQAEILCQYAEIAKLKAEITELKGQNEKTSEKTQRSSSPVFGERPSKLRRINPSPELDSLSISPTTQALLKLDTSIEIRDNYLSLPDSRSSTSVSRESDNTPLSEAFGNNPPPYVFRLPVASSTQAGVTMGISDQHPPAIGVPRNPDLISAFPLLNSVDVDPDSYFS